LITDALICRVVSKARKVNDSYVWTLSTLNLEMNWEILNSSSFSSKLNGEVLDLAGD
jgi:hypothetical protein